MSNPNFIINDSEAESDSAIIDEPPIIHSRSDTVAIPFLGPSYESSGYQIHPTSGELRKKEIDEAHAALLSTGTLDSPTQIDPPSAKSKANRRQTAHGRLEGSGEQDVYAFNASDDDNFHPSSESRKRKRPPSEKEVTRKKRDDGDEANNYDKGVKLGKKKVAKRSKSTGLSVLDLLNDSSEDDWRPNTAKTPTSGKKSTRNNTGDAELLPPLPKPKRKPRESAKTTVYYDSQPFDGNLTLNFNSADTHSTEIQVAGTGPAPPTPQNFMVDLTKNDLALPSERRAEYHPVSPGFSADESPTNPPGTDGVYNTPDLRSTIPDPPYDPSLLPSQIGIQQTDSHVTDTAPLATVSIASDSPLSSLQNSPARETPVAKKPRKERKRAATDQPLELIEDNGFGSFPVASEWRAAKGKARHGMSQVTSIVRSKTLNDIDAESGDDGVWVGDGKVAKKKKKSVAKKRKPTANEDGIGEGGVQKERLKRKKSKPIETLVITDSEDELAGPGIEKSGTIQVAGTADITSPVRVENKETIKTGANPPLVPTDDLLGTIAVSNPLLDEKQLPFEEHKPPGSKKLNKWQQLTKDTTAESDDEIGRPPSIPMVDSVPTRAESGVLQQPVEKAKKQTTTERKKSKKSESEGEDWIGDSEPIKKKKGTKAKAPRLTKKAAAAAAAKEMKELKEKALLSTETVKDSDDEEGSLVLVAMVDPESEPVLDRKTSTKESKPPTMAAKKARAQREKAAAEETASEDEKKEVTPVPETKSEPRPQTPSKNLTEKAKKTPHSPISKGPVKFRVGLSRRAHIEPLLKIIRK